MLVRGSVTSPPSPNPGPAARRRRPPDAEAVRAGGFYDYGVHDAQVLTHSPAASVRRPRVSDESQAVGPTADELRLLHIYAAKHLGSVPAAPPRSPSTQGGLRAFDNREATAQDVVVHTL